MPKLRLFLVVLLAGAVALAWTGRLPVPVKDWFQGLSAEPDSSVVEAYRADFTLQDNGDLEITERLDVRFTEYGKHGIYRIFDTEDAQYATIEHPVEVQAVERKVNGQWQAEPWIVSQEGGGTVTIRIGDAGVTVGLGVQKYRIVSSTTNALTPADGSAQWYWDVVGSGWAMPMRDVLIRAQLPPTQGTPLCETSAASCEVSQQDGAWEIRPSSLEPRTPVTVKAQFDLPVPPAPVDWGRFWLVGLALLFAALTIALSLLTFARSRERRPAPQLRFEPPAADPLVCAWLLEESPAAKSVPAVLLNLVAHKVVTFDAEQRSVHDDKGPDWITLTRTDAPVPPLVGFEQALMSLGLTAPGATRMIQKKSVSDGKVLSELDSTITHEVEPLVEAGGLARRVGGSGLALLLSYLCLIGGFSALIWLSQGLWIATALLVAAAVGLIITRRDMTQLTASGAQLRDQTLGFKQVLSTSASMERFDYAARIRHFDEYLPWAVAFDCAEEWAASCTPPPGSEQMAGTSTFYSSPTTTSQMWALSTGVVAVEASAVAAYHATQSSSSSGGGGGGGGGSGGGGGGSW